MLHVCSCAQHQAKGVAGQSSILSASRVPSVLPGMKVIDVGRLDGQTFFFHA